MSVLENLETRKPAPVTVPVVLRSSRSDVWSALTDPGRLTQWAADQVIVDLRAGGRYAWWGKRVVEAPDGPSLDAVLTALEPPSSLSLVMPLAGALTAVTLTLRDSDEGCLLTITHDDFPSADEMRRCDGLSRDALETVWTLHGRYLRDYVELGSAGPTFDYAAPLKETIRQSLSIPVSDSRLWRSLTTPEILNRWIATDAEADLRPGGVYRYGWGGGEHGPGRILTLEPERRLVTDWWESGERSEAAWTVGDGRVAVTHTGLNPDPCLLFHYTVGWFDFLYALRAISLRSPSSPE